MLDSFTQVRLFKYKSLFNTEKNFSLKPPNVQIFYFITGREYHTTCFHCSITSKDWQEMDSTWKEHCKWSQRCPYVLHNKGKGFVLNSVRVLKSVIL
jgi:hypothetical protein